MGELTPVSRNEVYHTWGENKTRIDAPFLGPEYTAWQTSVPPDVRKIVSDFTTARQIARCRRENITPSEFKKNLVTEAEYPEFRKRVFTAASDYAEALFSYCYPNGTVNLMAVALVGSSLYQPREKGDIDLRFVFVQKVGWEANAMGDFQFIKRNKFAEKYGFVFDPSPVQLLDTPTDQVPLSWLVQPHAIIKRYYLPNELHKRAMDHVVETTRGNKEQIYKRAKEFLKPK